MEVDAACYSHLSVAFRYRWRQFELFWWFLVMKLCSLRVGNFRNFKVPNLYLEFLEFLGVWQQSRCYECVLLFCKSFLELLDILDKDLHKLKFIGTDAYILRDMRCGRKLTSNVL